jgi:hypothetical protein
VKKDWEPSEEDFNRLLGWLDSDRERAGEKYEQIRRSLIKMSACRGCHAPEELADETINRVTSKVAQIVGDYHGDPAHYFYGVAKIVHLEYVRTRPVPLPPQPVYPEQEPDSENPLYDCFETCVAALDPASRTLLLDYYREEKQAKIEHRKQMAARLGISGVALRLRAYRLRADLLDCVAGCAGEGQQEPELS